MIDAAARRSHPAGAVRYVCKSAGAGARERVALLYGSFQHALELGRRKMFDSTGRNLAWPNGT